MSSRPINRLNLISTAERMFRAEVAIRSGLMGPILRYFRLREMLEIAGKRLAERGRLMTQSTPRARTWKGQALRKDDEARPAARGPQGASDVAPPRVGRFVRRNCGLLCIGPGPGRAVL